MYKKQLKKGEDPKIEKDPMNIYKEGVLFKKSQAKLFSQQWQERYFILRGNKLTIH